MRTWAFAITAVPTFMTIPAMLAFVAMLFSGYTGRASLIVAGAIILAPFGLVAHFSPYGKWSKGFMYACIAISAAVILYYSSLMPESVKLR
jgi:hypothetical protein